MSFWKNRTLCDVLEEMRKCHETRNYSPILALVEEAQHMGNRMESALSDQKDLLELSKKTSKARKEYRDLQNKIEELKEQLDLEDLKKNS